jgi:mRNA interferase RelE/StbE
MKYRIEVSPRAKKQLFKFDKAVYRQIIDYLDEIAELEDPRARGKELGGALAGIWRYRSGDYRILCRILDEVLVVLVVDIGHRKDIYRRPG